MLDINPPVASSPSARYVDRLLASTDEEYKPPESSLQTGQAIDRPMGRSPCCEKASVKRGPWSQEEDAVLRSFVQRFGNAGNWITLPQKAGLRRCGKSCRLRWLNYLRPALRHGGFTDEEDSLILSLYDEIGSKWSVIAAKFPGRTDNDVKNYWNTKLKKRYLTITRETTSPPLPTPTGGDSIVAAAGSRSEVDRPLPPPPPPPPAAALVISLDTLDTADDDGGELTCESEQLYAELMGLIESTTSTGPSTGEATSSPSSPLGASPAAISAAGGSMWQPHGTVPLPESSRSSSLGSSDGSYGPHAFGMLAMPDSYEDLLASTYDEVTTTQEWLY